MIGRFEQGGVGTGFRLPSEGPKCKTCSNTADEFAQGAWYCESHVPTGRMVH